MNNILAVFYKEIKSSLSSVSNYIILAIIIALLNFLFLKSFFIDKTLSLGYFFELAIWFLITTVLFTISGQHHLLKPNLSIRLYRVGLVIPSASAAFDMLSSWWLSARMIAFLSASSLTCFMLKGCGGSALSPSSRSSGAMFVVSHMIIARLMRLSNSLTFPGQS